MAVVSERDTRATPPGTPDAVIVGSGPNGLAAALTLVRAGLSVEIYEGADTPGGGCRTQELTLSGFAHDVCSTVHPLLAASPFFAAADLRGVSLRLPEVSFAHPLDGGRAAVAVRSVAKTAAALGSDARSYQRLLEPPRRRRRRDHRDGAAPAARGALPSDRDGALWRPRTMAAHDARTRVQDRGLARAARRSRGPLDAPAERSGHGGLRAAARHARAHGRLAGGRGRQRACRGRATR